MVRSEISFPGSEKEVVSGIDLQNGLSAIFFEEFGSKYRLVAVAFRFPWPLERSETADVFLWHLRSFSTQGTQLKVFAAHMTGRESRRTVLYGRFIVVPEG